MLLKFISKDDDDDDDDDYDAMLCYINVLKQHAYFPVKDQKISNPGQIQDIVESETLS